MRSEGVRTCRQGFIPLEVYVIVTNLRVVAEMGFDLFKLTVGRE